LRKLRTIAGRLVRELERKLDNEALKEHQTLLENCNKIIAQKKTDNNKIYSLHEPETACIAKGKSHKKFEFGSKVSIALVPGVNIIVGVKNFNGNPNDTTTLEPTLEQVEEISGIKFKNAIVDRGYKEKTKVNQTIIVSPKPPGKKQPYRSRTMRRKCRSRAAIEPVIGHVKHHCRMAINYLKETIGNEINALFYQALSSAIKMAKLTGNDTDIPGYKKKMNSIADNYNRVFWTGTEYRSPGYKGEIDDRGHGLAVLAGLAQPNQWPQIKEVLTQSFQASPYMEKYILEALFKMGYTNTALTRMKSRYSKMLESEYTTLWEGWGIGTEGYGGGSYNHGWSGGPLTLMMQYLAGIEPLSPGFEIFQVKPQIGYLNHIDACFESVKGYIEVSIDQGPDHFPLKLNSPLKTMVHISIPVLKYGLNKIQVKGKTIWQNGEWIGGIKGVFPT
jgi:hypothetical protein